MQTVTTVTEVVCRDDKLRPTTPLETSQSEPSLSKSSGHAPSSSRVPSSSPTSLGGTYRIGDGNVGLVGGATQGVDELEMLNESALESKKQLTAAEEKLVQSAYNFWQYPYCMDISQLGKTLSCRCFDQLVEMFGKISSCLDCREPFSFQCL